MQSIDDLFAEMDAVNNTYSLPVLLTVLCCCSEADLLDADGGLRDVVRKGLCGAAWGAVEQPEACDLPGKQLVHSPAWLPRASLVLVRRAHIFGLVGKLEAPAQQLVRLISRLEPEHSNRMMTSKSCDRFRRAVAAQWLRRCIASSSPDAFQVRKGQNRPMRCVESFPEAE